MNCLGSTLPIHSRKACVVYDATSGQIRHLHRVVTFVGGREPADEEVAADALRALNSLPTPPTGVVHVLHVDYNAIEPGKRYRVDPNRKALVSALESSPRTNTADKP
jgi:hypothetical protein